MLRAGATLDWLDDRPTWQFVTILDRARWILLVPVLLLSHVVFSDAQKSAASIPAVWRQGSPFGLLLGLVLLSPLLETLLTCTLPYWFLAKLQRLGPSRPSRPWIFVTVSACFMVLLHPLVAAILPTLITGGFLAYCYARFAAASHGRAILTTTVFHAAINLVGWTILMRG